MKNIDLKKIDDKKAIAYLSGRLDVAVSGDIEDYLMNVVENEGVRYLLLNMDAVEYMSSSGFRVAIALLRKLKDEGGQLKICCLKPSV
ncbi:MAG: STAS domain-containing protein, partial [Candidatus Hydrogenedentota bacterium]